MDGWMNGWLDGWKRSSEVVAPVSELPSIHPLIQTSTLAAVSEHGPTPDTGHITDASGLGAFDILPAVAALPILWGSGRRQAYPAPSVATGGEGWMNG